MRVSERIRGRVYAELRSAFPETFLNACAQHGLDLHEVERRNVCTVFFYLSEGDWEAAQRLAVPCQAELSILQRRGGSQDRKLLRRRWALLAALAAAFVLLLWSNLHIWRIEVNGCEKLSQGQVLRALEDCGVREGTWWPGLSTDRVRSEMLLKLPELAWMTVNVSGSRAIVSVVERVEKPEIYQEKEAADIVASQTGIVRTMTVLNGHPLVMRGSAVIQGETLVTGAMDSLSHPTRYVRAEAQILADTWYDWTAVEPIPGEIKGEEIRTRHRFALQVGKKRINLFSGSRKGLDGYDKIVHEYIVGLEGLFALPVRLIREEYRLCARSESPQRPVSAGEERLRSLLTAQIDGEILQVKTESFEKNGCIYTGLRAHCEENIAQTAEIPLP